MTTPVTGPFSFTRLFPRLYPSGRTAHDQRIYRTWYRQKKPYTLPLEYHYENRDCSSWVDKRDWDSPAEAEWYWSPEFDSGQHADAYNKAYAKLIGKLGDRSMWAVNLIEGAQSVEMIANRCKQLLKFSVAVKRLQFGEAARILRMVRPPNQHRLAITRDSKSFANNWLEYHFGWEPLVKDIGAGIESICGAFLVDLKTVKASGTVDSGSFRSDLENNRRTLHNKTTVRIQTDVVVKNYNDVLLSELGFTNPMGVLWEIVPFSFVVDWFSTVGAVLDSYTNFHGLELKRSMNSFLQICYKDEIHLTGYPIGSFGAHEPYAWLNSSSVYVERRLGLPGPTVRLKPFHGFSVVRAATAAALLTQFLKH